MLPLYAYDACGLIERERSQEAGGREDMCLTGVTYTFAGKREAASRDEKEEGGRGRRGGEAGAKKEEG